MVDLQVTKPWKVNPRVVGGGHRKTDWRLTVRGWGRRTEEVALGRELEGGRGEPLDLGSAFQAGNAGAQPRIREWTGGDTDG